MRTVLAFALSIAGLSTVAAQTIATPPKVAIQVQQSTQTVLQAERPFSSVAVADPEVADALPRSDRMLVIVGKKPGTTDLIIFSDATPMHHVAINVVTARGGGRVLAHNRKDLSSYTAYQCNPVCARTDDKYESSRGTDIIILTPQGPVVTNSTTNIIAPAAPAR